MIKKLFNLKILFLIIIFLFAIPSLLHFVNSGVLLEGKYFHYFINSPELQNNGLLNAIIYAGFFILLFSLYFFFLKNRNKVFEDSKKLIVFIGIASLLFALILPITSSDVFSYATTGEIQSEYGANPYYEKISDVKNENDTLNNEILSSLRVWDNQLVIYGPLWSLICSIVTFFSFSKISIALILFKILAVGVHIINAVLIFKITKKNFWVILYGLNPYILFETISNVHNDLYVVLFILLALYFFVNRKKLVLPLFFLACATCVKYITVLLVPMLLIYYYRNENIGKRILKCIKSGLLFSAFVILIYLIYLRNIEMIFYVLIQQGKFRESISSLFYVLCLKLNNPLLFDVISNIISWLCIGIYILFVLKLLFKKDINFKEIMNKWNSVVLILILVYISNLCIWYFAWLFGTVIWQKARNIRIILYLPFIYEMLISYYFFLGGEFAIKSCWFSLGSVVILSLILVLRKKVKRLGKAQDKKLCKNN